MIDGTGKETGSSSTGDEDRLVDVRVAFVGQKALVLVTSTTNGKTTNAGQLVFIKENDLEAELAKLRVGGV